jgi:hypothetical protein
LVCDIKLKFAFKQQRAINNQQEVSDFVCLVALPAVNIRLQADWTAGMTLTHS